MHKFKTSAISQIKYIKDDERDERIYNERAEGKRKAILFSMCHSKLNGQVFIKFLFIFCLLEFIYLIRVTGLFGFAMLFPFSCISLLFEFRCVQSLCAELFLLFVEFCALFTVHCRC